MKKPGKIVMVKVQIKLTKNHGQVLLKVVYEEWDVEKCLQDFCKILPEVVVEEKKVLVIEIYCDKELSPAIIINAEVWRILVNTDIYVRIHSGKFFNKKKKSVMKLLYSIGGQFEPQDVSKALQLQCTSSYKDKYLIIDEWGNKGKWSVSA